MQRLQTMKMSIMKEEKTVPVLQSLTVDVFLSLTRWMTWSSVVSYLDDFEEVVKTKIQNIKLTSFTRQLLIVFFNPNFGQIYFFGKI